MKLKNLIFFPLLLMYLTASSQADTFTLKVHFLYGSKPKPKFKDTESKYFGGLHGGHVTVEVDNIAYGLGPIGVVHIFSNRKKKHSGFAAQKTNGAPAYLKGQKFKTIIIPITKAQHDTALPLLTGYCGKVPYDYAFFGMRCAAAARDVLGVIHIYKERSNFRYAMGTFYPKKLRRRLLRLARKNNYTVISQEGRVSRKWEKD